MSKLVPSKRSNLTRGKRVDRASNLILATGLGALVFVVALVLAIAGVIGGGLPLAAAIVTAGLGFGAYRTIKR
jgi:Flp pilus assembly protein TadB